MDKKGNYNSHELADIVKKIAIEEGFAAAAVTRAELLVGMENFYHGYLRKHYNADMSFLENNLDKRFDPTKLMPEAKSIICLAMSYAPKEISKQPKPISYYAHGRDYHKVLKKRAIKVTQRLAEWAGAFDSRVFVDTAPVEERQLAVLSGLGWQGKNGMVIIPGVGSMVMLAEIFCSLELAPDMPCLKSCGLCEHCLRACPTGAIQGNGLVDARKCISYHTIENRSEDLPLDVSYKLGPRIFGCDACAVACPYNREIPAGNEELIDPDFQQPTRQEILDWDFDDWDNFTRGSARRRATLEMYKRNAAASKE